MKGKRINCYKCENYYVTWEKTMPHGCRAMGFKSRLLPSIMVKKNTGHDCYMFKLKGGKTR